MNFRLRFYTFLLMLCMFVCSSANAFADEETIVEFASTNASMEDNPKQNNYNITIFSPDGKWKMQINYYADSMFGSFTAEECRLSGDGKYYNYVRNPKNDMVFYSFKDVNVKVTDEGSCYRVNANCLTNNNMRFLVEATIDVPLPEVTVTDDLGYARIQPNSFYETINIHAENENYKLSYGIVSSNILGTFYRADMLMPELYDKKADKQITVLTANAVHTQEGENTLLHVDLISDEHVLYSLNMFNGPYEVEVREERDVLISGMVMQDLREMYGFYQFGGMGQQYQMAIAVKPEALESGKDTWTKDDLILQYTALMPIDTEQMVDIFDISVGVERSADALTLKADVLSLDGVLYHVTMIMGSGGYMPEPKETVNIDFGHVYMLDYTQGMGTVGIGASKPGQYQMRFYLDATKLEGEYVTEDFYLDLCDIMEVEGSKLVFHDARYMKAKMEKQGDRTIITADMYAVNDVLYHATMYVDPMQCMQDGEYSVDMQDYVGMISLVEYGEDGADNEFTLQFQNMDNVYDEDYNIIGDGFVFTFHFAKEDFNLGGQYGYSAGTLSDYYTSVFFENSCEVRVAPVAGTLELLPQEPVRLKLDDMELNTYLYNASFKVLGQNGVVYTGRGCNFVICIDEDGYFVELDEEDGIRLAKALEEKGMKVRKVLKGGKIVIESTDGDYDLSGRRMR